MADRTAPQTAPPSAQPSADPSAEARGEGAAAKPDKQRPVLPPMPAEQPAATKPARGARKSAPARKAPASNGTGAGSSTPTPAVQPAAKQTPAATAPAAPATAAPAASSQPVRKPVLPPPPAQPAAPKLPLSQRLQAKFGSPGGAQAAPPAAPRATPPPTPAASPRRAPQAAPPPGPGDTAPVPVTRSLADGGAGMAAAASSRPTVAPTPVARAPKAPRPAREAQQRRTPAAGILRPSRRARLRLTRIDPWSVMKTAFLLSVALGIVTVVAVMTVWSVLGAAGLWESINATVQSVLGGDTGSTFDVTDYLGTSRVLGFTTLVAIADVVLLTAIATLAAFLYNMAAALLGGIELTLTEDGN